MPTTTEMYTVVNKLITTAELALRKHRCNDADAARKTLQQYHNIHLNEMPPWLVARARESIFSLALRTDQCFLKWGSEA